MVKVLSLAFMFFTNVKTLETLNYGTLDMDTVWGRRPVYVSYWAIWCTNCVKELDRIQKVKDSLDLFVIAINEDGVRKKANVLNFIRARKWDFVVVMDEGQNWMKKDGVTALPTSFLYGKDGVLLKRTTGFAEKDIEELKRLLSGSGK